jgi:hypothetical protein
MFDFLVLATVLMNVVLRREVLMRVLPDICGFDLDIGCRILGLGWLTNG